LYSDLLRKRDWFSSHGAAGVDQDDCRLWCGDCIDEPRVGNRVVPSVVQTKVTMVRGKRERERGKP
jgi:hypothetical protein